MAVWWPVAVPVAAGMERRWTAVRGQGVEPPVFLTLRVAEATVTRVQPIDPRGLYPDPCPRGPSHTPTPPP